MAITSKEIIDGIEKKFPFEKDQLAIRNFTDANFKPLVYQKFQFIIGVAKVDPMGDYEYYKQKMRRNLGGAPIDIYEFSGWTFFGHEKEQTISILTELGQHYEVDINANTLIESLEISDENDHQSYVIVITVIGYYLLYAG